MKIKRRSLIVGITILIAFGSWLFYWFSSPYWYYCVGDATVMVDGRLSARSELYRNGKGGFLIVLHERAGIKDTYVIPYHRRFVGTASNTMFLFMGRWIYCKEANYYGVALDGSEAKVENFDAQLAVGSQSIDFSTPPHRHIHIVWQ